MSRLKLPHSDAVFNMTVYGPGELTASIDTTICPRNADSMWVGDILDERFVIERPLGQGGMGSVFLALDRRSGARVAVKTVDLVGEDSCERFDRESRSLATIEHPAVVRFLGSGRTPKGDAYLVMEWLEGEDLSTRLANGPLPLADALTVCRRAAEGLAAVHASGVVHRDVKPANLFLVDGDPARLKVIDFGIARTDAAEGLTRSGTLLGTVGYMAPEQALNSKGVDARADVFSLGCVLYECVTGRVPFASATPLGVLSKLLSEAKVTRPSELRPGVSPALDDFCLSLLARRLDDRPADARVLVGLAARLDVSGPSDAEVPKVHANIEVSSMTAETRVAPVGDGGGRRRGE